MHQNLNVKYTFSYQKREISILLILNISSFVGKIIWFSFVGGNLTFLVGEGGGK